MTVLTECRPGILTLTLQRPEKKNALTAAMYHALTAALHSAEQDDAVRVILIQGQAGAFTAGNDLEDFLRNLPEDVSALPVMDFMQALSGQSKPVVAAVTGVAVGIGTTLLLHCDLVYAAREAKFSLPFAQLGLCPEFASSLLLPQLMGHVRAAEKLMLGEPFSADEAKELGLVNQVLPMEAVSAHAQAQASKLAALPSASLCATKQLMRKGQQAATQAAMQSENLHFGTLLRGPAAQEALTAFLEKRRPNFQ